MTFFARKNKFRLLNLLGVLAMLLALVPATTLAAPAGANQNGDKLGKADRQRLAQAKLEGKATVTLIIAAKDGENSSLVNSVKSLGGEIRYQDNEYDYIRVDIPTDKAEAISNLAQVEAVDVDETIVLDDPAPEGRQLPSPQTPPGPNTPRINPYMPIGDTGAAQFVLDHPKWDGRNVTIGIIDSGVDLGHPALSTTTTGERKIIDWVTYTHPVTDDDPTWLNMKDSVTGATFTYGGVTYTAPGADTYRIALFNERDPLLGGELGNDVNRDGNPAGSSGIFAVLWNKTTNIVWVDTNQNNSFADEKPMTDYKVNYDIGTFGTDNPATSLRESMPFVVQTNSAAVAPGDASAVDYINIGIVSGEHGTHVAGITSANKMFGGNMTGAAPGAKIVSVRVCLFVDGCTAHALVEGMIYAASVANVDVINMSIGGLPALNDGNNARAELYNRLIDTNKVQMFISAGNDGAGVNTIGDPGLASKVVAVGSYISKDSWKFNYGSIVNKEDNLHPFSSRGPREDGGFKPDIVAPGSAISTIPTWMPGGPVVGTYDLPPGYAMLQGTSMASPQAAGAAALLISASKAAPKDQSDDNKSKWNKKGRVKEFDPAQLRQALITSARLLDTDRYQVYEQGNGLIDIEKAWNLIKKELYTVTITSQVEVHTVLSGFLATPGVGLGIYDREGVKPNTTYTREYTFTRSTGPSNPITYKISWVGDDDTFSSDKTIVLPLNQPVKLTVKVKSGKEGIHSAILNLQEKQNSGSEVNGKKGIAYQTMNVVIAAAEFNAANSFSVTKSGLAARNQALHYFFRVPAGTPAFKVDLSGNFTQPGGGQVRFLRFHPYGVSIDTTATTNCYTPAEAAGCANGDPLSRTVSNPQPGVWEVVVEARRTSDTLNAPFTLRASVLGASVSPNPDVIANATLGAPVARSYTLTNLFGTFTGRAEGSTLGSARVGTVTIADGASQQFQVNVAPGSTSLRATIGGTSDAAADLDLFVYRCTTGSCVLAGQSADGDAEESVTINNPAAGIWIVLVDGYSVPSGSTTYNYVDVFVNPAFGSVAVTDANAVRAANGSWAVAGTVTANAVPAAGRVLLGNVLVKTDTNIVVGSGDVIVQSVTP